MKKSHYSFIKEANPNQEFVAERLAKQFPVKYTKDSGKQLTIRQFIEGLADLYNKNVETNILVDFIDREFLFGCWGYETKFVVDSLFLSDMRGAIIAAYKIGLEHGSETAKF